MNVKEAVAIAKEHIEELFGEEDILNLGLEEVELDEEGFWRITIGFSRPWNRNVGSVLAGENSRSYKIVVLSNRDGDVRSVKDWNISKAM
ncbi:MAG: hypothetical protein OXO52_01580 [Rhodospirillales bacterium]|nr:hypothetical protein [Rhodospirillales bacterium]MDE0381638.1 hypothetical protein [Rhodospirillales bacterium]